MYRVELKENFRTKLSCFSCHPVPNVPCGVESHYQEVLSHSVLVFLMYRVELKDENLNKIAVSDERFLMYRVELKDRYGHSLFWLDFVVPNVPCGVESGTSLSKGERTGQLTSS